MRKYDVAVVGAGLGGLAVAALLTRRKNKTILYESGASVDGTVGVLKKAGFTFTSAPDLAYGFEPGGAIQQLSAGLGIVQKTSANSPSFQVALPDRRITRYAEREDTLEELRREFPGEIDSLARFYGELHKEAVRNKGNRVSSFLSRHRAAAGFLRKYRFSREVMIFLDLQSRYFFQKPVEKLAVAELVSLCDTPPRSLKGGFKGLAEQLYGMILREGGEIRCGERIYEFAKRRDKIIGVKTAKEVTEAGIILLNVIRRETSSTLFIGLRNEVVPVGMCRQVLFLPDYARPRDFISLSLNDEDEDAVAPQGMRTLTSSYYSQNTILPGKQALVEHVNTIMPFLNDFLICVEEQKDNEGDEDLLKQVHFHPLRSHKGGELLFRGSNKNVYFLNNARSTPHQALSAAQRFVERIR